MQIQKGTCNDLREKRLINKLYMDQSVQLNLDRGGKKRDDWKTSRKRMLFVAESIQTAQRVPYKWRS